MLPYPLSPYCKIGGQHHPYMARMVHSIQHLLVHKLAHICIHPPANLLPGPGAFPTMGNCIFSLCGQWIETKFFPLSLHLWSIETLSQLFDCLSIGIKFICPVNTLSQHKELHFSSAHFCIHGRVNPATPHLVKLIPIKNI